MDDILNRSIFCGDVLDKLDEISSQSIDCIISSPPYWGLRDYGVSGQIGVESDFMDYLKTLSNIMVQLKRVLKNTGTCWINLGDTYASGGGQGVEQTIGNNGTTKEQDYSPKAKYRKTMGKSRFGIPERFYINCIDNGWIARNHIAWYKANSMPSSVKDRFTNKWESIFFFTKNQKYYFNLDGVREKTITESRPLNHKYTESLDTVQQRLIDETFNLNYKREKYDIIPESNASQLHKDRKNSIHNQDNTLKHKTTFTISDISKLTDKKISDMTPSEICILVELDPEKLCFQCGRSTKRHVSTKRGKTSHSNYSVIILCNTKGKNPGDVFFVNTKPFNKRGKNRKYTEQTISRITSHGYSMETGKSLNHPKGKNPGDIFFINTRPFTEAHFATFPVELPLKILKCACPPDGIVLDPFFGAGTVGVAAELLGRRWCGIELNKEYIKIAQKRLSSYKNTKLI